MMQLTHIGSLNNNYFNGTLKPVNYAAKFSIYNENIDVRSNWDIEGINLEFK